MPIDGNRIKFRNCVNNNGSIRPCTIGLSYGRDRDKTKITTIKEAITMIGKLGGHIGRKSDGPPGMKSIWTGWRALKERHEFYLQLFVGKD